MGRGVGGEVVEEVVEGWTDGEYRCEWRGGGVVSKVWIRGECMKSGRSRRMGEEVGGGVRGGVKKWVDERVSDMHGGV